MSRQIRDREMYEHGSKWFADWHRRQDDDTACMIDLDGVGYCRRCSQPLYLVEATESTRKKNATVTEKLGQLAGIEVFVFYRDPARDGELCIDWRSAGLHLQWMSEQQAWNLLISIRRTHFCADRQEACG